MAEAERLRWESERRKLADLRPQEDNPRHIDKASVKRLRTSWDDYGQVDPLAVGPDGSIYNGHQRYYVLLERHGPDYEVDVRVASRSLSRREWQRLTVLLHEGAVGGWDFDGLANWDGVDVGDLVDWGFDEAALLGHTADLDGMTTSDHDEAIIAARATLAERFIVPPFSVLDARQGYWQDRKRAWIALGIKSEIGRGGQGKSNALPDNFRNSRQSIQGGIRLDMDNATSIFDPVLCECAYSWWTGAGFSVLDLFAGGSVRGIVAEYLGREYTGIELRDEQIEANIPQAAVLELAPRWICGDSANVADLAPGEYDFIFSCPPYYNLEVYSELDGELSAAPTYEDFVECYRHIVAESVALLKDNRFACFVVGDLRDNDGLYRNFVSDTVAAFVDAGMPLYNEAILVTPLGTVMMQTSRNFPPGRKLGKTHQNVLVFVKGDWRKAVDACGPIEIGFTAEQETV